jgi:hypothetical protein
MKIYFTPLLMILFLVNCGLAQTTPAFSAANSNEVEHLMQVLTNEANFKTNTALSVQCIRKAGDLKVEAAIPILIEHIDIFDPIEYTHRSSGPSIRTARVATKALIRIGKPSTALILKAAKTENDRLRQIFIASVIHEIEGQEEGLRLVEKAVAESKDLEEQERLKKIADFIIKPPVR